MCGWTEKEKLGCKKRRGGEKDWCVGFQTEKAKGGIGREGQRRSEVWQGSLSQRTTL